MRRARLGTTKWGILKYLSAEISCEKSEFIQGPTTRVNGVLGQKLGYDNYVFIMRVVMMFLLHQGRRPRRWKEIGTIRSWVGLDTLYVSRKSHVCYELGANTCWYICMLDECCSWNLMLVYSLMRMLCSCLFMQDIINDACLILLILYYDWCKTNP